MDPLRSLCHAVKTSTRLLLALCNKWDTFWLNLFNNYCYLIRWISCAPSATRLRPYRSSCWPFATNVTHFG